METTDTQNEMRRIELLAIRCQLGEREAFDTLVRGWHRPLWQYLRGLIRSPDAVDECLQDAWLKIVRSIPRLRDPARLKPWMFSIARRTAMDHLRARYREEPDSGIDPDQLEAAEPGLPDDEVDLLEVGLSNLGRIDREVLTLFYLKALSIDEVADVLDVPIGTVKSRLHRARQSLRDELNKEIRA